MPYPAANVNGQLTGPWTQTTSSGSTINGTSTFQRMVDIHPASKTNPIRPDGTRGMSSWSHYGGRWSSPTSAVGLYEVAVPPFWRRYTGCIQTASITPSELQVWAGGRDAAKLKALGHWSERQVELSAALAQAKQTAKMVGDLGKGLAEQMTRAASRGGGVPSQWKRIPGWYLQYLYGWKPLMDDLDNITTRLVGDIEMGQTMHVRLTGKWKGRAVRVFSNSSGGTWGSFFNVNSEVLLEQTNRTVLKYMFPSDRLPNLKPTGFFGTTWELVPYSFVLDKLSPVGSWLSALDANALAIYFQEGCSSEMVRALSIDSKHEPIGLPAGTTAKLSKFETTFVAKPYKFTRLLENPLSLLTRIPFRSDLNLSHAAQGLALLTQAMKR